MGQFSMQISTSDGSVFDANQHGGEKGPAADLDGTHLEGYKINTSGLPYEVKPPWDTCAECKGGVSYARFAYHGSGSVVTVTDKKGRLLYDSGSSLPSGTEFDVLPLPGKNKLGETIFLTTAYGAVGVHTSCSKPVGPGLEAGDFTMLLGASKKGGADMCPVVRIDNQFGTEFLTIEKPKRLLVPTIKNLVGPPVGPAPTDTDHYKCYDVKSLGLQEGLEVTLEDQFETRDYLIEKTEQLCNPVEKNHGAVTPIQNEAGHLACYKLKPLQKGVCAQVDPVDLSVYPDLGNVCNDDDECSAGLFCRKEVDALAYLYNQFGDEVVNVKKAYELCVPSTKIVGLPDKEFFYDVTRQYNLCGTQAFPKYQPPNGENVLSITIEFTPSPLPGCPSVDNENDHEVQYTCESGQLQPSIVSSTDVSFAPIVYQAVGEMVMIKLLPHDDPDGIDTLTAYEEDSGSDWRRSNSTTTPLPIVRVVTDPDEIATFVGSGVFDIEYDCGTVYGTVPPPGVSSPLVPINPPPLVRITMAPAL